MKDFFNFFKTEICALKAQKIQVSLEERIFSNKPPLVVFTFEDNFQLPSESSHIAEPLRKKMQEYVDSEEIVKTKDKKSFELLIRLSIEGSLDRFKPDQFEKIISVGGVWPWLSGKVESGLDLEKSGILFSGEYYIFEQRSFVNATERHANCIFAAKSLIALMKFIGQKNFLSFVSEKTSLLRKLSGASGVSRYFFFVDEGLIFRKTADGFISLVSSDPPDIRFLQYDKKKLIKDTELFSNNWNEQKIMR